MRTWVKNTALLSLGFLSGITAMGLAYQHCDKRPTSRDPDRILDRLSEKLDLNEGQKLKVAELLKKELPKGQALQKETHQKFKTLRLSFDRQLMPLLDDHQKKKLEAMEAQWENPH